MPDQHHGPDCIQCHMPPTLHKMGCSRRGPHVSSDSHRLTRKQCAGILNYAQGYLDGRGYASEYPGLLGNLSAALFASSEEVTVVGWQIQNIRFAADAAGSFGASDIASALRHVATTLEVSNG